MKSFIKEYLTVFNVVKYIFGSFIIGWWFLIARNFNDSDDMKYSDWSMWRENLIIGFVIFTFLVIIYHAVNYIFKNKK